MAKKIESNRDDMINQYLTQWREARAKLESLQNPRDAYGDPIRLDDSDLAKAKRKVEILKAKMAITESGGVADFLLYERDLEAGVADAVASDLAALVDNVDAVTCSPDAASVARANAQITCMIRDAMAAHDRYAARRLADGLPTRQAFPAAGAFERPIDAIRRRVRGDYEEITDYPGMIRKAEGEVRTILLSQAKAKQEEELEAERQRQRRQSEADDRKRLQQHANTESEAKQRQQAAREAEEDELIRKYLAHVNGGSQFNVLH